MISTLARITFYAAALCVLLFFIFAAENIKVDTNLGDLNPAKQSDEGLEYASNTLIEDINQRFIIVVKSTDKSSPSQATALFKNKLNTISGLEVLSNDDLQTEYLSILSPYRFNLLSEAQVESLQENDVTSLAIDAQRKLYQLGDGIRLIPFDQDPLGWFSDFLLSRFNELSTQSVSDDQAQQQSNQSELAFESFNVHIKPYPPSLAEQEPLYQQISEASQQVQAQYSVDILHSGMFFFAVDSAKSAKGDIQLIAIGSTVGVLVLMLLVFRSLLPLCLSLGSIALGVGFGVFVSTMVFGSIHILTIVFGASLIGIVVDYSLHYFYHFLAHDNVQARQHHQNSSLVRAMVLSVITSLIGYGALGLSDLTILKKVALFSCSGLLMAWLGVMVLGPLISKRPIVARQRFLISVIKVLHSVFAKYPKGLAGLGLLLAAAGASLMYVQGLKVNDDPRLFFHVSPSLLEQEQEVASLTQVYEPGRYLVVKGDNEADVYSSLNAVYDALGEQRQQLASVLDWIPSSQIQSQHYELQKVLYEDEGVVDEFYQRLGFPQSQSAEIKQAYAQAQARYLDFASLSQQLPSLPPLWLEHEQHIYSFVLIRKNSDFEAIEAISQHISSVQYINTLGNAVEALKDKRETGAKLLVLAYVLIAIMLMAYYRTIKVSLLLLIPAVASIITLSTLAVLGQPITIFHVMALFLVLGLGMDYIIFAREMTEQQAITQQAILLSAVTSLLSFGLLAFSSMPVVQAFGSTILIGNSINFIAAISLFNAPRMSTESNNVG